MGVGPRLAEVLEMQINNHHSQYIPTFMYVTESQLISHRLLLRELEALLRELARGAEEVSWGPNSFTRLSCLQ